MQTDNRLFDDLARLAAGAMGAAAGVRAEIEARIKAELQRLLADVERVPPDEFEAVKQMAATARAEQEALTQRVAQLEAAIERLEKARK
jgi:BMFP domain-containing protein YqiC